MRRPRPPRTWKPWRTFLAPDPRHGRRQRYCTPPACRQASQAARPHRWRQKPRNRAYCTGPPRSSAGGRGAQRIRAPGDARARAPALRSTRPARPTRPPPTPWQVHGRRLRSTRPSFPTLLWWLGVSPLAPASRYQRTSPPPPAGCHNGGAIYCALPHSTPAVARRHTRPLAPVQRRRVPPQGSWVEQRLVRERALEQRRPAACARALLLSTVADAQGLRDYAEPSLGPRGSLTAAALHQARQGLRTRGFLASQRPLSPGRALDAAPRGPSRVPRPYPWTSKRCWRVSGRCGEDQRAPLLPAHTPPCPAGPARLAARASSRARAPPGRLRADPGPWPPAATPAGRQPTRTLHPGHGPAARTVSLCRGAGLPAPRRAGLDQPLGARPSRGAPPSAPAAGRRAHAGLGPRRVCPGRWGLVGHGPGRAHAAAAAFLRHGPGLQAHAGCRVPRLPDHGTLPCLPGVAHALQP